MTIIPVIDLLQGKAVHALRGMRDSYRPLNSQLCHHGKVLLLIHRLLDDYGFRTLYIADLDAIQGQGDNLSLLSGIVEDFPDIEIWFDGGFSNRDRLKAAQGACRFRSVIGSETWRDAALPDAPDTILSVDIGSEGLRDPSGITTEGAKHPENLILMNLEKVGAKQGPDLELLQHWRRVAPKARLYAAGGVRQALDLHALKAAGASGVLLASALHTGDILPAELAEFS